MIDMRMWFTALIGNLYVCIYSLQFPVDSVDCVPING